MNPQDPPRWLDADLTGEGAGDPAGELAECLREFHVECTNQPYDAAAGLARFEAGLAIGSAGAPAASVATTKGLAVAKGLWIAGGLAITAGAVALGLGALQDRTQDPLVVVAPSAPDPDFIYPDRPSPPPPQPAKPTTVDPLQAELKLVREVRRALKQSRPHDALRLLDDGAVRFAQGTLIPERTALRVIALSESGQLSQARRAARQFVQRFPKSPMTPRVREVLVRKSKRR